MRENSHLRGRKTDRGGDLRFRCRIRHSGGDLRDLLFREPPRNVICMTIPFVLTYSFEAVLKDGLSVFQNSRPNVVEVSKLFGLKIYFQTLSARCRTRSCLRSRVLQPLVVRLSPWQVLPPELCILHRNSSVSHFLFSLLRGGIFIISHLETGCQLLLYQITSCS